jgi:flagellin-like hook-associated protein FlgL
MPQSITLTASMRSNLASLKTIQGQMDTTQTRLSTGKKVNSAIDNASSYYQSRSLTNRAADLDGLLDSMGQGIQTIQAANEGIEAVTSFIEQAKSVANSAFALDASASDYTTQVENYQDQYNAILDEIDTLAKDSSYQGTNLLTGGKLSVMFNETRTHKLDVQGKDIVSDMAGSNIGFTDANWLSDVSAKKTAYDTAINAGANAYSETAKFTYDASSMTFTAQTAGVEGYTGKYYTQEQVTAATGEHGAVTEYKAAVKGVSEKVNASLDSIAKATDYLRDYSSELGNNFSIIETRQNFTEALIDVLETGSDNLVLADMNEESANYLALQTRQQLAINSLALASQSAQSVLSLF